MYDKTKAEEYVRAYMEANSIVGDYKVHDEKILFADGVFEAEITSEGKTTNYYVYQSGRLISI